MFSSPIIDSPKFYPTKILRYMIINATNLAIAVHDSSAIVS